MVPVLRRLVDWWQWTWRGKNGQGPDPVGEIASVSQTGPDLALNQTRNLICPREEVKPRERKKPTPKSYFRRLKARLGAPKAITAMANKLAKLVYRLMVYGKDYFDIGAQRYEQKFRLQQIRRLQKQAKLLNLKLVPA